MTESQAAGTPSDGVIDVSVLERRIAMHKAEIAKRLEDIKSLQDALATAQQDIVARSGAIQDLQELRKLISCDPAQKP